MYGIVCFKRVIANETWDSVRVGSQLHIFRPTSFKEFLRERMELEMKN